MLYSQLVVVGELGSGGTHKYWLLLLMVLHLLFAIWISLVFFGLCDCLKTAFLTLGCFRSPGRPAALAVADHMWGISSGVSSEVQRSC